MSDYQWDREVKARKTHICDVCRIEIAKGTTYHKQSGIFDSQPYTWKTHTDCAKLYWKINKDHVGYWDDPLDIYDFDQDLISEYRGLFPHAVTRTELKRHRWIARHT